MPLDSDLTSFTGFTEDDLAAIRERADLFRAEITETFGEEGYEIPDDVWEDVQRTLPQVMSALTQQGSFILAIILAQFVAADSLASMLERAKEPDAT